MLGGVAAVRARAPDHQTGPAGHSAALSATAYGGDVLWLRRGIPVHRFRRTRARSPTRSSAHQRGWKTMTRVAVAGSFDDLRSRHIRFFQEASRLNGANSEVH